MITMRATLPFLIGLVIVAAGCQTAKPAASDDLLAGGDSTIQAESSGFSPNGDGFHDQMMLSLYVGKKELLAKWSVEIRAGSTAVRHWSGASPAPAELQWDGKDDAALPAPGGSYVAYASLSYDGATAPIALTSKAFALDATAPAGSISVDPVSGFVPGPTGVVAPITFTMAGTSEFALIESWNLEVLGPDGKRFAIFSGKWPASPQRWDGRSVAGVSVVPNAKYSAILKLRDEFGLEGRSTATVAVADLAASKAPSGIAARRVGFSPTSVSVKNTLDILLTVGDKPFVKAWAVSVQSPTSGMKKEWKGEGSTIPEFVVWDGRDGLGKPVPEGRYFASLSVDYGTAFKQLSLNSAAFAVVMVPPQGSIVIDPPELQFDGKGGLDPATFIIRPQRSVTAIASWTMTVKDDLGKTMNSWSGIWPDDRVAWDAKDKSGVLADPGKKYTVSAQVKDEYGNEGILSGSVAVGALPEVGEASFALPSTPGFSPNGDGVMDTLDLSMGYGEAASLVSWKVEIVSEAADSKVIRSIAGTQAILPPVITWDGMTNAGTLAPEGSYKALFTLAYGKVFAVNKVASPAFVLDLTAPKAKLEISPALFSPGSGGKGDIETLKIVPDGAGSDIQYWSISVYDPAGNLFANFFGDWPAAAVKWDGTGISGELVQSAEDYVVRARIIDRYGNAAEFANTVPIDILVVKTAKGYLISMASIVFKAFTADFTDVPADRARRNRENLALLVQKLQKFPDYRIRIVGHAVMINWDDPAAGKIEQNELLLPLSKARSDAIRRYLVANGIPAARIGTEGVGAANQAVPDSDLPNRWKNRRVEFYLEK
jgi:flagellar hook assembly protein FlgD